MSKKWILGALVVVAGVLAGLAYNSYVNKPQDRFAACRTSKIAAGASAIGGPFTLVNGDGKTVTDKDVITGPTLIYFGYTFCPDVCPLDNTRNGEAVDILAKEGKTVTPVFISIDPKRDTPAQVKAFAAAMHPRMIGLTGTPAQVKAASKAYHTYFKSHEGEGDGDYYLVDHSTYTYLVLPKYGFVDFFTHDDSAETIAKRTACYIDAS